MTGSFVGYECYGAAGGGGSLSTQCPYCFKVLKYKANLKIHIQDHHSEKQDFHNCPFCEKTFKSSGSLRDHKSKYHKF